MVFAHGCKGTGKSRRSLAKGVSAHQRRILLFPLLCSLCKVVDSLKRGYQAMVFVHSRKDTGKTARALADLAGRNQESAVFDTRTHARYGIMSKDVRKSR